MSDAPCDQHGLHVSYMITWNIVTAFDLAYFISRIQCHQILFMAGTHAVMSIKLYIGCDDRPAAAALCWLRPTLVQAVAVEKVDS